MGDAEKEPRLFNLTEAERARREVEPILMDAMQARRELGDLDDKLGAIAQRIQIMGGITLPYESVARLRMAHNKLVAQIQEALERIQATGCVVKDLETGLIDFPSQIGDQEVYLCWRLGEDRIRFWHRQDEGFSGRKPLDAADTGPKHPIQ
jgi:hypothetical protein